MLFHVDLGLPQITLKFRKIDEEKASTAHFLFFPRYLLKFDVLTVLPKLF